MTTYSRAPLLSSPLLSLLPLSATVSIYYTVNRHHRELVPSLPGDAIACRWRFPARACRNRASVVLKVAPVTGAAYICISTMNQ